MTTITLKFFSLEDELSIDFPQKTTIKEMKEQYAKQKNIPSQNFGQTTFLIYNGLKLSLDSKEKISKILKDKDTIFVLNKGDKVNIDTILEHHKNKINIKTNSISTQKVNKSLSNGNKNIVQVDNSKNTNISNKNSPNNNTGQITNKYKKELNDFINKDKNEYNQKFLKIDDYLLIEMVRLSLFKKHNIYYEKSNHPYNFQSINDSLKFNNTQFFILGVLGKYLEKIGIEVLIDKEISCIDIEELDYYINLFQFICNGYILKYKYIIDFELIPKRIKQLAYDIEEQIEFNKKLKNILVKEYKLKDDELVITNFKFNKNKYSAIVIFKSNFNKNITKNELFNLFKNVDELNKIIKIEKELLIPFVRLNRSLLDQRGDNKDDKNWGIGEVRGGEDYFPPIGWIKYGLKVANCFDGNDNSWLGFSNNSGEWCIAYCGLAGISKYWEYIYENDNDIKHQNGKVGIGINCYQKPELMDIYSEDINANGIKYKIGFMLRVKPDMFRCTKNENYLWITNGNDEEIRPYGILIRKV